MLTIRREVKRRNICCAIQTRGPFLTESQERDAGWRQIVVILYPQHLVLRHVRGSRQYSLAYEKAVARRDQFQERRRLKRTR